jgi:hypothetical protein
MFREIQQIPTVVLMTWILQVIPQGTRQAILQVTVIMKVSSGYYPDSEDEPPYEVSDPNTFTLYNEWFKMRLLLRKLPTFEDARECSGEVGTPEYLVVRRSLKALHRRYRRAFDNPELLATIQTFHRRYVDELIPIITSRSGPSPGTLLSAGE